MTMSCHDAVNLIQRDITPKIHRRKFQWLRAFWAQSDILLVRTPPTNAQCWSMPIRIVLLIPMPIKRDQCRSNWEELIGIGRPWDECHNFDRHWALIEGVLYIVCLLLSQQSAQTQTDKEMSRQTDNCYQIYYLPALLKAMQSRKSPHLATDIKSESKCS